MFKQMRELKNGEIHYFFEKQYGLDWFYYPELVEYGGAIDSEDNSVAFFVGKQCVSFHEGLINIDAPVNTHLKMILPDMNAILMDDITVAFFKIINDKIDRIVLHTNFGISFTITERGCWINESNRKPRIPMIDFNKSKTVKGLISSRIVKGKKQYLITVGGFDDLFSLPSHTVLVKKLDMIKIGSEVEIEFLGKKMGKNGFEYFNYGVKVLPKPKPIEWSELDKQPQESLFNFQ